jgi:putative selenium metabolism protein SsnA
MLIYNSKIVTWGQDQKIIQGHAVRISEGLIVELGPEKELLESNPDEERIDAEGQLLMPGNVCAHTHFYGAYARGMAIPGNAPKDFPEILDKLWWPLDKALDEESIRFSTLIHLIDAIRNGTTTLIDHHASPNFIDGSLDVIGQEVDSSGLRAVLCYEVSDRDGEVKAKQGIDENVRFMKKAAKDGIAEGRIAATFGLHASLTLSDQTLQASREAISDDLGFHIHLAEHEADQEDSQQKSGMRATHRLNKFGILGPNTITAHAVHVDQSEIDILAQTETWLTHQPRSNMNNGVGVADVETLMNSGVNLCIGNDGFTQDMWAEWKMAYLLHKVSKRDPRKMNGSDVIKIAVENNSNLAASFFPGAQLGEISPGARADLILVDYHPFTPLHEGNLPWHILFGFQEKMVTMTMVAGKVLMRDRKLLTLDEEKISAEALKLAPDLWKRYESYASA